MPEPLFAIPLWIDLVAVAIGAIQGAMFAGRFTDRRMDLLGISIIGITVGLGGGLLRDILLGGVPAALLSNWYLPVAAVFALGVLPGSIVGARLNQHIDPATARNAFGLLLVALAIAFLSRQLILSAHLHRSGGRRRPANRRTDRRRHRRPLHAWENTDLAVQRRS